MYINIYEHVQALSPAKVASVVYFDQRTGAPHSVRWLKSFLMLICSVSDGKSFFTVKKLISTNEQTACGAPVCWLKYTAGILIMDLPTGPAGQPDLVLEFYVAFDRTCPFTKSST